MPTGVFADGEERAVAERIAGASPGHLQEKARYERERLEAWFRPE